MKKLSLILIIAAASMLQAWMPAKNDGVITKEDGMYVVNTTQLSKNVVGYVGATPVKIYIKKNRIVRVEALKNQETPKHNAKVKRVLLTKWEGMKVADALKTDVDGVTGATFTSDAIIENVKLGLSYYQKNK